jgi:hypothetical protein
MPDEEFHLSDQEFVLAADGELDARRAAHVRAHLAACWDCRARMAEIEDTIADFARAYRQSHNSKVPPIEGPRALLKAQLAELAAASNAGSHSGLWTRFSQFTPPAWAAVCTGIALFVAISGSLLARHSRLHGKSSVASAIEPGATPDRNLTPGVARTVTVGDVCSMAHEEVVRDVPASLRQEIFQEYGLQAPRARDYEIDYLIAPGLGGAEDIHNLWPQPYTSRAWNARVKDALEEHLHQLVCAGTVDLPTAQRDIATDWIAAYKKYFHTDRPLAEYFDMAASMGKS